MAILFWLFNIYTVAGNIKYEKLVNYDVFKNLGFLILNSLF